MIRTVAFFLVSWLSIASSFAQTEFQLGIEVRDKYSKRVLIPIISVLPVNSAVELGGHMVNDQYVISVKPDTRYQVVVAFQEYKTYRQIHTFEQNIASATKRTAFVIDLEPLIPPKNVDITTPREHSITIIDKNLRKAVPHAVVVLRENKTGNPITVKKGPNNSGGWMAALKEGENYTIEVTATDYKTTKENFTPKMGEATQIFITRIPKQEVRFQAVDALTGQPIHAEFRLTDEVKENYTGTTSATETVYAPLVIIQPQPYLLTVMADGYRKYESKMDVSSPLPAGQTLQIIKLTKGNMTLKIKVIEEQTGKPILSTLRIIQSNDKKAIFDQKNIFNGKTPLSLNPNGKYTVEAEAKGYMPFQKELEKALPILSETNDLTIALSKIGDIYLSLTAVNVLTGQPIAATFKIKASLTGQLTYLKGSVLPVKRKIVEPDIYRVETVAAGYLPLKGEIDAEEIGVGQVFNYEAKLMPTSATSATAPRPATKAAGIAPIQTFTFSPIDAQNQEPIAKARLKITNQDTKRAIPSKPTGTDLQARLKIDQIYLIEAEAKGYEKTTMTLEMAEWAERGEFLTNIALKPLKPASGTITRSAINEKLFDNIKAGQSLSIEDNVYFDQSSYILRTEAYGQLLRLATVMAKNPDIQIEIVGHTDNIGDPRLNQILSEQRAKVIANFLAAEGIKEARIVYRGEGGSKPLAPNDTEVNRKRNRRVQFLVK